ncbi:hypothetical protein ACFWIY_05900 [Streptomyces sioyaensis]|uniref:Lsr2 family DNA-binding protein n=1 Tax=Streptomyces sioyaensis TaxID=67364 RepID=UPI00365C0A74
MHSTDLTHINHNRDYRLISPRAYTTFRHASVHAVTCIREPLKHWREPMNSLFNDGLDDLQPRGWRQRSGGVPWIPGNVDQIMDGLFSLLESIRSDGAVDRPFVWEHTGAGTTVRSALHSMGSCGLVHRPDRKGYTSVTLEGAHALETRDSAYLIKVFHANVKFIGEALSLLREGRTHGELNDAARDLYQLQWTTLDQVRRRTSWFRAAGLVDLWKGSNRAILTDLGIRVCQELVIINPADLPGLRRDNTESISLSAPGPLLAGELQRLDRQRLTSRKPQIGYIAGGSSVAAIRTIVNMMSPEVERSAFLALCAEQLDVKESSADQSLHTLRLLGLIEQTGPRTYAPTDICLEWLSTDQAVDLVRILHSKVSMVGEVLHALPHGGETSAVFQWLRNTFPQNPIGRAEVSKRLLLLQEAGLAERITHTAYTITTLGQTFAASIPTMEITPLEVQADESSFEATPPSNPSASFKTLAHEVVEAATDSANPARFEKALATCFGSLGIEVEPHGGPKKTDLCLVFWNSPTERRRVIVEAKTDGAGIINEDDVKFDALEEHRKHHQAEQVIIIGPGFGGRLPGWAKDKGIPLITAEEVSRWLIRAERIRLLPRDFFRIITAAKVADTAACPDEWDTAERGLESVHRVAHALWESGNDGKEIEYSGGALTVRDIWRTKKESALDPSEIQAALDFLSSPLVRGASVSKSGEYVAASAPSLVAARLRCLADGIDQGIPTLPTPGSRTTASFQGGSVREEVDKSAIASALPAQVRAWARSNGRPVSVAGRLPHSLVAEYLAAQQ